VCPHQIKDRVRREREEVMQTIWEVWAPCLEVQKWRRTKEDSGGE